jgi:hypothetical protein
MRLTDPIIPNDYDYDYGYYQGKIAKPVPVSARGGPRGTFATASADPFRDFRQETKIKSKGKKNSNNNNYNNKYEEDVKIDHLAVLYRPPFEICFNDTYEKV